MENFNRTFIESFQNLVTATKKRGFWGRLLGAVAVALIAGTGVGGAILAVCAAAYAGSETFERMTSIQEDGLTDTDVAQVNQWDKNIFTPFFIALIKETEVAFNEKTLQLQIAKINVVLNKICAVKQHYSKNPNKYTFASNVVVNSYIISSLTPIVQYIELQLDGISIVSKSNTTTPLVSLNIGNVVTNPTFTTVYCTLYKAADTTNNTPIIAEEIEVTTDEQGNVIIEPTGVPVTQKDNTNTIAIVVVGLAIVIALFTRKKEKK